MDAVPVIGESSSRTSVPVSVGALVVAVLGTVAAGLAHSRGGPVMVLLLYWPTLASLSGMITAFLERRTRGAMMCFWFALALFAADVVALRLIGQLRPLTVLYFLPMAVIALVAPFLSIRLRRADVRAWRYYAAVWLIPVAFSLVLVTGMLLLSRDPVRPRVLFGFMLGVPFGPWASQVVRLVSFPNAGEGFYLPLALAFTLVLAMAPLLALIRRRWAAHSFIPFAWIMAAWSFFGMVLLLSCTE
jgi:hypothetical protein